MQNSYTKLGPGKRIDLKTKKLVVQMNMNGASYTDISRQIGISRKSVRRIISNYKTFGLLEKKRGKIIVKFVFFFDFEIVVAIICIIHSINSKQKKS